MKRKHTSHSNKDDHVSHKKEEATFNFTTKKKIELFL